VRHRSQQATHQEGAQDEQQQEEQEQHGGEGVQGAGQKWGHDQEACDDEGGPLTVMVVTREQHAFCQLQRVIELGGRQVMQVCDCVCMCVCVCENVCMYVCLRGHIVSGCRAQLSN
jgi:hypothetical protein